jgi:hypothetical protein
LLLVIERFIRTLLYSTNAQVLDTIEHIGSARKNQYAAFVREEGVLVVWADTVQALIPTAKSVEASLVAFLWADETDEFATLPTLGKSPRPTLSRSAMTSRSNFTIDSKVQTPGTNVTTPSIFGDKHQLGQMPDQLPLPTEEITDTNVDMEDPYKAEMIANRKLRPVSLIAPFVSGIAVALAIVLMCLGLRKFRSLFPSPPTPPLPSSFPSTSSPFLFLCDHPFV